MKGIHTGMHRDALVASYRIDVCTFHPTEDVWYLLVGDALVTVMNKVVSSVEQFPSAEEAAAEWMFRHAGISKSSED